MPKRAAKPNPNNLRGARAYLSGPMDFLSTPSERESKGWRLRVAEFLREELHVYPFDPTLKPKLRGLQDEYGREDTTSRRLREHWTFDSTRAAQAARGEIAREFWPVLHLDLRMVDVSDFVIAYCPTSVYSVGTVHEIILTRQQHKPALVVSPRIDFPAVDLLFAHLQDRHDEDGQALLNRVESELLLRNLNGAPSIWYALLVGAENFFDGFGFKKYVSKFRWAPIPLDDHESRFPPRKPLLPFLLRVNKRLPTKYNPYLRTRAPDDDWILWNLDERDHQLVDVHQSARSH